jgi:uncharacterized protein (DUF2235 family)
LAALALLPRAAWLGLFEVDNGQLKATIIDASGWHRQRVRRRQCGLLFGNALLSNIEDAYRFLMDLYEDGDHIYLFGFSRGAYTVRGLAGVLHMFGLPKKAGKRVVSNAH